MSLLISNVSRQQPGEAVSSSTTNDSISISFGPNSNTTLSIERIHKKNLEEEDAGVKQMIKDTSAATTATSTLVGSKLFTQDKEKWFPVIPVRKASLTQTVHPPECPEGETEDKRPEPCSGEQAEESSRSSNTGSSSINGLSRSSTSEEYPAEGNVSDEEEEVDEQPVESQEHRSSCCLTAANYVASRHFLTLGPSFNHLGEEEVLAPATTAVEIQKKRSWKYRAAQSSYPRSSPFLDFFLITILGDQEMKQLLSNSNTSFGLLSDCEGDLVGWKVRASQLKGKNAETLFQLCGKYGPLRQPQDSKERKLMDNNAVDLFKALKHFVPPHHVRAIGGHIYEWFYRESDEDPCSHSTTQYIFRHGVHDYWIDDAADQLEIPRSQLYNMVEDHLDQAFKGKSAFIPGSENPRFEIFLREFGKMGHITTLEYRPFEFDYPNTTVYPVQEYWGLEPEQRPTYDVFFSYSNWEHDGLGRYGDPYNPLGDLDAIEESWTMLRHDLPVGGGGGEDGKAVVDDNLVYFSDSYGVFGAPGRKEDALCWNAHRVYGFRRLVSMLVGYSVVAAYDTFTLGSSPTNYCRQAPHIKLLLRKICGPPEGLLAELFNSFRKALVKREPAGEKSIVVAAFDEAEVKFREGTW